MASALLASRAEPLWGGGDRKVYARKNPNPNPTSNHTSNPSSDSYHRKPNPNPKPNSIAIKQLNHHHHGRHQFEEIESVSPSISDERGESTHGGFVTFNIAAYTKRELKDLKKRLVLELEEVQRLRDRIELRNIQPPQQQKKPFGGGNNKRPAPALPFDSIKRPALEPTRVGCSQEMMMQCGQILTKLMASKHGWVFNVPVDVVGMGLHDYNSIVTQPMDLGTVKSNLGQGLYSNLIDFASDVRLTFNNALMYNPKGHDVYVMAKGMLTRFETLFRPLSKKFQSERHRIGAMVAKTQEMKWGADRQRPVAEEIRWEREAVSYEERRQILSSSTRTPTPEPVRRPPSPVPVSRPVPPPPVPALAQPIPPAATQAAKQLMERLRKLPKPKARDVNKRDMTFEEKQKLSLNLQDLPPDKMDQVVQIMRRGNATLSQNDDEIEVDIEVLDKETLWELDRFVGNYRKMMCKAKRQQELEANNRNPSMEGNKSPGSEKTESAVASEKAKKVEPVCVDEDIDIGEDIPTSNFPPVEIEKDVGGGYASGTDSDSSSGSDSSSSSDSDSGSSSGSDSDGDDAQSPSPNS